MVFLDKHTAWNKGLKGFIHKGSFKKGHIFSKDTLMKMSMAKKGKPLSEEHKKNLGLARLGKKVIFSKEHKDNLSKAMIGKIPWNKGLKGFVHKGSFKKGHIFSKDALMKMSMAKKGIALSEEHKRKLKASRSLRIIPFQDTSIEIKIQNFLKQLNIEFLTHQYIKEIEHRYQCDIFIPAMKTIIECDGDYWHGNKEKFPNLNDWQVEQAEEDNIRTKELIEKGFKVLRIWETEINEMNIDSFKERL